MFLHWVEMSLPFLCLALKTRVSVHAFYLLYPHLTSQVSLRAAFKKQLGGFHVSIHSGLCL